MVRVVTMAMVGVGIMAMGVVGVAALSIRGRVLVAITGVTLTGFYREKIIYIIHTQYRTTAHAPQSLLNQRKTIKCCGKKNHDQQIITIYQTICFLTEFLGHDSLDRKL